MKKTITNVLTACGALFACTLIATNYGAVSSFFGLLGGITKGLGNITLVVLGQSDRVGRSATYYTGNIGDDGSGDSLQSLDQYREVE